eukprot:11933119-Ditylum_brightwellii.AAC.1
MVVSKPGKVGLWMFWVAVGLGCGLLCLIYTKMHTSCIENSRTIACSDIVKDWGNMIIDHFQCKETTLSMDSYYLTDERRKWLRGKKVQYIASLSRSCFRTITKILDRKVDKSGTFSITYNKKTKESALLCWSSTKMLGKKFVMGTGFKVRKKDASCHVCPMFDQYSLGFNNCDKFNKVLHDKTWPHKLHGDKRAALDYLFAYILINVYHLWIDAVPAGEKCKDVTWKEFCMDLAKEMVM